MIPEKALALAGTGAHLVRRPAGRLHVYTGPLTPSGRFVPRNARTVCRTRTRRLEVVQSRTASLDRDAAHRTAMCGRCSARLNSLPSWAEHTPTTRAGFLATYAAVSKADLAIALEVAQTPAEVDAAAHLSLVLFDVAGTIGPFTDRGRTWPPLHQLVCAARGRVDGYPAEHHVTRDRLHAISVMSRAQAKAERQQVRAEREAKIARLGFINATSNDRRGGRKTTRGARP